MRSILGSRSVEVAFGFMWLGIFVVGLAFVMGRSMPIQDAIIAQNTTSPESFDEKMRVLEELEMAAEEEARTEEVRLDVVTELDNTIAQDDRASVHPKSKPVVSLEDKLRTLEALRDAQ